jgi:hypothetical protein
MLPVDTTLDQDLQHAVIQIKLMLDDLYDKWVVSPMELVECHNMLQARRRNLQPPKIGKPSIRRRVPAKTKRS